MDKDKKEYMKEYYEKNKDRLMKQQREWREKNKDILAASSKEYQVANKESRKKSWAKKYKRNREKIIARKVATRRRRIIAFKELKGGKCHTCGYDKNYASLDFHHVGEKSFAVNTATAEKNKKSIMAELEKCILLCRNCHGELHYPQMEKHKI